jgi:hypothetical protein
MDSKIHEYREVRGRPPPIVMIRALRFYSMRESIVNVVLASGDRPAAPQELPPV